MQDFVSHVKSLYAKVIMEEDNPSGADLGV